MTPQINSPERFVVVAAVAGVDSTNSSKLIVESASRIAASTPGGELHLVHVLEGFEPPPQGEIPNHWSGTQMLEVARRNVEQLGRLAEPIFRGRVVGHLAVGEPWREIAQFAERLNADLIVVGSHGRTGVRRLILGSVSELVTRQAKCPVLVVRPKDYSNDDVPTIEPACADCLAEQARTNGASLW